jgi:hypothetical protein
MMMDYRDYIRPRGIVPPPPLRTAKRANHVVLDRVDRPARRLMDDEGQAA